MEIVSQNDDQKSLHQSVVTHATMPTYETPFHFSYLIFALPQYQYNLYRFSFVPEIYVMMFTDTVFSRPY